MGEIVLMEKGNKYVKTILSTLKMSLIKFKHQLTFYLLSELNRAASNSDPNLGHNSESAETLVGDREEPRFRTPYGET